MYLLQFNSFFLVSMSAKYEFQLSHKLGNEDQYAVYAIAPWAEPFNPRDFDSFTFISKVKSGE